MDLYFSPAAQVELDDAVPYLEGEQPGLGYRFTADVDEAPLASASLAPLIDLYCLKFTNVLPKTSFDYSACRNCQVTTWVSLPRLQRE